MTPRGSRARFLLTMPVLVFLGLLLTSPDLLHAHRSTESGIYNAECPLAEISARHADASLPSAPGIVPVGSTVEVAPAVGSAHLFLLFARSADSRAPPLF